MMICIHGAAEANESDVLGRTQDEPLERTLHRLMLAFKLMQEEVVSCFLPIHGLKLKEVLPRVLTVEEKQTLVDRFRECGYMISLEDDGGRQSNERSTTLHLLSFVQGCLPKKPRIVISPSCARRASPEDAFECSPPSRWKRSMEEHVFEWLFGSLNARAKSFAGMDNEPSEFEVFIPLYYNRLLEHSLESSMAERSALFERPIKWVNAISRYRVQMQGYSTLKVKTKSPQDIKRAEACSEALLFSTLLSVDRIADDTKQDWRNIPRTAMQIVAHFLVGVNVLA